MSRNRDHETSPPSLFHRLLCRLNRHRPAGHRAKWNGKAYVSRCEDCDVPIKRVRRATWRRIAETGG